MLKPNLRRWKPGIIGLLVLAFGALMSGCSTLQLAYQQSPTLVYWWLGRYVDFDAEQAGAVKAALADWHTWHRRHQLPLLADELARLQREAPEPATPEQACAHWARWQDLAAEALAQALPAAQRLAPSLSAAQIAQIAQAQAKQLDEAAREQAQPDAAERVDAAYRRSLERAERVYGRLDAPQKAVLREAAAQQPFDAQRWRASRQARQVQLRQQLERWRSEPQAAGAGAQTPAQWRTWVLAQWAPRDPAEAQQQRQGLQAQCALAARLHNATTPAQRAKAMATLKGWEQDLRAQAAPAAM